MTLRELFAAVDAARVPLLIALGGVVVLTILIGVLHGRGNGGRAPWRYLYAVLVYARHLRRGGGGVRTVVQRRQPA